ncbi:PspC domain-containing protein [Halalkalibacterium ligniniphilum]|uniref:PspC domain-containing protein n=1 Tax=Halalkalibacterium ligniniphilum TaxID=1134413 RepID=UPI000475DA36|nr:PspC domain-containing protein [Halalkalibacterium ligniniphilum]
MKKKLYRSESNRKIAGVCGGLADYFNMDATLVRIFVILLGLFTAFFPIIIGYILFSFVIPNEGDVVE